MAGGKSAGCQRGVGHGLEGRILTGGFEEGALATDIAESWIADLASDECRQRGIWPESTEHATRHLLADADGRVAVRLSWEMTVTAA